MSVYPDFTAEVLSNGNFKLSWDPNNPVYTSTVFIMVSDAGVCWIERRQNTSAPYLFMDPDGFIVSHDNDSVECRLVWPEGMTLDKEDVAAAIEGGSLPHIRLMASALTWTAGHTNKKFDIVALNPTDLNNKIAARMARKATRNSA